MAEGLTVRLSDSYADVVPRVKEALAKQGFGVLTEIDIQATIKAKLDADVEEFVILGACNPPLAKQALDLDRHIAVFLPCNVVVRATDDGTVVEAVDPETMVQVTGTQALAPVATEAALRLRAAIAELADEATGDSAGTANRQAAPA